MKLFTMIRLTVFFLVSMLSLTVPALAGKKLPRPPVPTVSLEEQEQKARQGLEALLDSEGTIISGAFHASPETNVNLARQRSYILVNTQSERVFSEQFFTVFPLEGESKYFRMSGKLAEQIIALRKILAQKAA